MILDKHFNSLHQLGRINEALSRTCTRAQLMNYPITYLSDSLVDDALDAEIRSLLTTCF